MFSLPLIETVVSVITTVLTVGGLAGLFGLMVVESFGIPPIPSEIILPFAGFLIYDGTFSWPGALAAAWGGGLVGAFAAYAVGRYGRQYLLTGPRWLRLDPRHLDAMDRWFARHGEGTVVLARLLPIIRGYISYPAGTARMPPVRFGVYSFVGSLPFTTGLLYAGFLLRDHWTVIESYFRVADYFAIAGIALALLYIALVWRGVLTTGFPPRLTRSSGSPPPVEAGPP
jgi:membrane protein DedA with SNARE-associated domain